MSAKANGDPRKRPADKIHQWSSDGSDGEQEDPTLAFYKRKVTYSKPQQNQEKESSSDSDRKAPITITLEESKTKNPESNLSA